MMPKAEFVQGFNPYQAISELFQQAGYPSKITLSDIPQRYFVAKGTDTHVYRVGNKAVKIYMGHFEQCASGIYSYSKRLHETQLQLYEGVTNTLHAYLQREKVFLPGAFRSFRLSVNPIQLLQWREEVGCMVAVADFREGDTLQDKMDREIASQDEVRMLYRGFNEIESICMDVAQCTGIDLRPVNIKMDETGGIASAVITDLCAAVGALRQRAM